ncbi:16S rRNA (cytidine(1402)-2'-O)-methyltransferase [Paenibacillus albiflavus]|uniref:Ribosomal RNA small subunit methyltransferase I n=1 Tax=Paenibacillus albiflavus TaxID=2545760 RepID=A0A4R4DZZ6_9BACL|nr:16S rRNA (cytidine(1402)-2'-O)-methyltransferase [Paenibacillus albiflavus]TCZ70549.1 16S rRNA (cytidine(1402)-2'-O)-methyltransferase [Paenibacillus albiflavus]
MISQKSYETTNRSGKLYLVGTPIGNLEDMTYRAVRILQEADLIAAEDTRQTRKLLTHFEISTRLVSYHDHNKNNSGPELVRLMREEGLVIALVSDAGLPAISDPGYELVCLAAEEDIPVIPIPGANAALSALIASGLPTRQFTFIGFLPRDRKSIVKELERLKSKQETLLFYESPHRVNKTLAFMLEVWGDRKICLARELTKRHEELTRGTIEECLAYTEENPPLGEYCIVVEPAGEEARNEGEQAALNWWESLTLEAHVEHYVDQAMNKKEAIKQVAIDRGLPKREVYNEVMKQD